MRAGPKGLITAKPLDFAGWRETGRSVGCGSWAEYVITPRGEGAGGPLRLRDWQVDIVRGAFAPGVRTALVSLPRPNGKTMLAAALAVAELFVGPPSAEVLVVASDERQAAIVLKYARIVELNPCWPSACTSSGTGCMPHTDATLLPLPAEPGALHRGDPSLLVIDELHVVTEAV